MHFLNALMRRLGRVFSLSEWMIGAQKAIRAQAPSTETGLVLIQIDGLSRNQLEQALSAGRMPFLQKLVREEGYSIRSMYSGLPSSTPAVQGELMFGVKTCVPAFGFRDVRTGTMMRMSSPDCACEIERRLASLGEPLLSEGSSYANVYSGGADEPHFCMSTLGIENVLRPRRPLPFLLYLLLNIGTFLRTATLLGIECGGGLSLWDFVRGIWGGRDLGMELKFIPTRVGICIFLRELSRVGACLDIARGLPIIALNLLGYDEQAHRRSPSSRFAHWSLGGIDATIRRITRTAWRSHGRDYSVWIYSDHGQESSRPYDVSREEVLEDALERVFEPLEPSRDQTVEKEGIRGKRIRQLRAGSTRGRDEEETESPPPIHSPL